MQSKAEIRRSLFDAISDNNLVLVKEIVNRYGLSYCKAWSEGYTLLCNATKCRRDEMCEFLLSKDAKVNGKKCKMGTPLHFAVESGSAKIVEMLINKHASVDAVDGWNETPLFHAARSGNSNIVRLLLNAGANCCSLDNFGYEPLIQACYRGDAKSVKLLLHFRKQKGFVSLQPLHLGLAVASMRGSKKVVLSLLNAGADPNTIIEFNDAHLWKPPLLSEEDFVPLLLACRGGHAAVIKLLLKHGAKLNCSKKEDNHKPLFLALNCIESVSLLLSLGADPNAKTNDNITPLHVAAEDEHKLWTVELLLSYGANVDAVSNEGMTPLLLAVRQGCSEVAKVLLEQGACVNAKDNNNNSPLFFAVERRCSSLIDLLLKYNPEIDVKTKESIFNAITENYNYNKFVDDLMDYGCCVSNEDVNKNFKLLLVAVEKGFQKVVQHILTYSVDHGNAVKNPSPLHVAVEKGHIGIIEALLKSGYEINARDKVGKMPIHYSMSCTEKGKWSEIFQILLANGAIVAKASEFLHEAVKKECFEICRILIKHHDADANALNADSRTPLQIVVSKNTYSDNYHEYQGNKIKIDETAQIVELLLRNGASAHPVTKDRYTVLHLAAYKGKVEIIRVLLRFGANVNERAKNGFTSPSSLYDENYNKFLSHYEPVTNGPTALHFAAQGRHAKAVQVLLEFDADIDIQEGDGNETALHKAVSNDSNKVVRVLLKNGCDINIENIKGETALDLAFGHIDYDEYYSSDDPDDLDDPNWNDNPDDAVRNSLKMHAIKLKVAGFYVIEKVLEYIKDLNPTLIDFQEECKNEINTMKSVKLCCHLTLYNVLLDLKNPAFMKNESLKQTLCSLSFINYPIYGNLIGSSIEKNIRKIELLSPGGESLEIIMKTNSALSGKKFPILVDDVSERILLYLSNSELKNLILAGESIKNQVCK